MNYTKKIVCLASSRKPGGRCVAGKEVSDNDSQWIRPVSARPSAEISLDERQYENGQEPGILDIIEIPMIAAVPKVHQTENHMIDAEYYWKKKGTLAWDDLNDLVDTPDTLWSNTDSTYHGRFDRMTQATASEHNESLYLIKPTDVTIRVLTPGADFGNYKRRVRADFRYGGVHYNLMVTDLVIEKSFLARENGDYPIEEDIYFCVSLAEAHTDNYCYKLVATVISEEPL
jgi:hypothetical protein